jgi:hypothetical protein
MRHGTFLTQTTTNKEDVPVVDVVVVVVAMVCFVFFFFSLTALCVVCFVSLVNDRKMDFFFFLLASQSKVKRRCCCCCFFGVRFPLSGETRKCKLGSERERERQVESMTIWFHRLYIGLAFSLLSLFCFFVVLHSKLRSETSESIQLPIEF